MLDYNLKNFVEDEFYIFYMDGQIFSKRYKRFIKPSKNKFGYLYFTDCNYKPRKKKYIHRTIYEKFYGVILNNLQVDHINNIKDDNRLINLQNLTAQQNIQKQLKNKKNTSGYKGISWDKSRCKWSSQIVYNGKKIHLGYFQNIEDAKNAYNEKAKYLNDIHDCHYILN